MKSPFLLLTVTAFSWAADVTGKTSANVTDEKRESELKEGNVEGDTVSSVEYRYATTHLRKLSLD